MRMPAAEVHEWLVFLEREPVWPQTFRYMLAGFFAIVCNLLRNISNGSAGTKIRVTWDSEDFLGNRKKTTPATSTELATQMHIMTARVNSQMKKRAK